MNFKSAALGLCILGTLSADAQDQSIGIQIGDGATMVRSQVFENHKIFRPRLNLGLTYQRFVGPGTTLSAELLYQQRGFSDLLMLSDRNGQPIRKGIIEARYNYLAMPVKVGYQFGGRTFGFGKVGLIPAILLNAATVMPFTMSTQASRINTTAEANRFDVGGIIEAGGGFHVADQAQLYAALAFQQSITSVSGDYYLAGPTRHYGFYLNLGFGYELAIKKVAVGNPGAEG